MDDEAILLPNVLARPPGARGRLIAL